jgi:hypothetical protein
LRAKRQEEAFVGLGQLFVSKTDPWEVGTLAMNLVTAVLVTIFLTRGSDVNGAFPWPHFLLAEASFIHSFIMFHYLVLRPTSYIVIKMVAGAVLTLAQFVVGCAPFFFAFVGVGVTWFGWYSPTFVDSRSTGKYVVACSYGDFLLDGYDQLVDWGDKPSLIGSFYGTIWVVNGMGVWFYTVLSILHASLIKEARKAQLAEEGPVNPQAPPISLPWAPFIARD